MNETIIGIDLGTTNSEVAVFQDGRVQVLETEPASKLLPSVVGLAPDGGLLVGRAAANQYVLFPERTIKSIKRRMGSVDKVMLGDQAYTPQEISALILDRLKRIATAHLGKEARKAVITVPAYFSDAQRQATRDAGAIAGLEVVRIINEPTAAALAYETEQHGEKHVLVYDLGGGTFDVSVVRLEKGVVEVLASHGNNHLGGDDFDQKIIEHALDYLNGPCGIDVSASRAAMARITGAAEIAKITLSDHPYAQIGEEYLLQHEGRPFHLSLEIARSEYEPMIQGFIDQTLEALHIALDGADLSVSRLDEVLLVGGATRTPLIQKRLEKELRLPPRSEVDPELCVAAGAAIQAAQIAGTRVSSVLVDVTPYTFGTSAISELNGEWYPYKFVPLIRKNTAIPVTKSEVFYTSYDGQSVVEVQVYQGEDPDALNNTEIGRFRVEGLSDVPEGNPIIATFSLDLDGILNVTAKEKRSGLQKGIVIDNATTRFEREEMDLARERVAVLMGSELPQDAVAQEAQALIDKAQGIMDGANEEDREDLIALIEETRDSLETKDIEALRKVMEKLNDLVFYLES
ncbi:MAG: Hsp70 family protein [Gammaproteobacteria bacterium]